MGEPGGKWYGPGLGRASEKPVKPRPVNEKSFPQIVAELEELTDVPLRKPVQPRTELPSQKTES